MLISRWLPQNTKLRKKYLIYICLIFSDFLCTLSIRKCKSKLHRTTPFCRLFLPVYFYKGGSWNCSLLFPLYKGKELSMSKKINSDHKSVPYTKVKNIQTSYLCVSNLRQILPTLTDTALKKLKTFLCGFNSMIFLEKK